MNSNSTGERQTKSSLFYGWWIVGVCFILLFFYAGSGFYSFSIFIKPLENQFGWSRAEVSLTMSIYFFVTGLVSPLIGQLCQSFGPKKIMFFGALGTGACFILVSFTRSLGYFYVVYAVIALAISGIGFVPVSSLLARWFVSRRGAAIGLAYIGVSVGGLMLAPIVGFMTSRFNWQSAYIFMGISLWILALPTIWRIVKSDPRDAGLRPDGQAASPEWSSNSNGGNEAPEPSPPQDWPLKPALKSRAFRWITVTFFLAPMAQMGVLQHQVPLIMDRGVSAETAATALGLIAGMGGLGKLIFGRMSDSLPFHWVAALCFGMQALGVLILLGPDSIILIWLYVAVFGFGMGGVIVLQPLAIGKFFGVTAFGVILGVGHLIHALGASIGAYTSGWIYDTFGDYRYALTTFILMYLAAIVSIFLAGRPSPYTPGEGVSP